MTDSPLASLDLGSNTFRLLLAEGDGRGGIEPKTKRVFQEIPRLSEGLAPGRPFGKGPLERAWAVLDGFQRIILESKPEAVLAGATMAVRLASDGESFLKDIEDRYGWETKLLSGPVEAYLSASGVLSGLPTVPHTVIVFDIGGGSTEFVYIQDKTILRTKSLDLGVVRLSEGALRSDPPAAKELAVVAERVREALNAPSWDPIESDTVLIGTAGTVTTIAAMLQGLKSYSPEAVNGYEIPLAAVKGLLSSLSREPLAKRAKRAGLPPGRADVIVPGLVLVRGILDFFKKDSFLVSDNGLLEGLWLLNAGCIPVDL
jgi:exopolyphosphatase/guanosine-5'-triphosphate,3'-diphosphate pyrophosphatase